MKMNGFWGDLHAEVNANSFLAHPLYNDLAGGRLNRETIAEMLAQIKYCVTEGIGSLALIIPQVPRPLKAERPHGELRSIHR